MALHVKGYTKLVNGKLITVGDYDADRMAAVAVATKVDPDRPPMVATPGKYGMAPHGQMPLGRDVPGEPLPEPPVIDPVKAAHVAMAHAAIAAGKPTDPKTGHALPELKAGQSLRVSTGNKKKWAVVEKGAVHHLIDKDSGAIESVPKSWHASHAKGNLKEIARGTEAGTKSPEVHKAEQAAKAAESGGAHDVGEGGHTDHPAASEDGSKEGSAKAKQVAQPELPQLTGSDIHDQPSVTPELSADETQAVEDYTGPYYPDINAKLRSNRDPSNAALSPMIMRTIENLNTAIAKSRTDHPILVHRGIAYAPWLPPKLKSGTVITDKGFVSTSTDYDVANRDFAAGSGGIRFDITVPAGHPALSVKNESGMPDEAEVILPAGTQFKVSSDAEDEEGVRVVKMQVVSSETHAPDETEGVSSMSKLNSPSLTPVKGMAEVYGANKGHLLTVKHPNGKQETLRKSNNGQSSAFHDRAGNEVSASTLNSHRAAGKLFHGDAGEAQGFAKPTPKPVTPALPELRETDVHEQPSMAPKPKQGSGEATALDKYRGANYGDWNSALRDGKMPNGEGGKLVKALDGLIGRAKTKQPIVVYRGVQIHQADAHGNVVKENWLPQLEPGAEITDKGFVSTTSVKAVADQFRDSTSGTGTQFEIHVPAGASALSVPKVVGDPFADTEQEVLLPRGSKFQVVSDKTTDGGRVVVMNLVMDAQGGLHEHDSLVKAAGFVVLSGMGAAQDWLDAVSKGIQHVLLVVKNNPLKDLPEILTRPDIQDALQSAGQDGADAVSAAITDAWEQNGGPDGSPYLQALLDDAVKNGNTFANRMSAALAVSDHDEVRNVLERDRLRASAGESVAATKARSSAQLLSWAAQGVTQVRWMVRSNYPCSACLALAAGPPITLGDQFNLLAGGLNLPVYHDLTGPPRHPGCECELVEA